MKVTFVQSASYLAAITCLSFMSAVVPAAAQYMPEGSYAESCRDVYMSGPYLNAMCRRIDGGWTATRIYTPRCGDDGISNHDGVLSCGAY